MEYHVPVLLTESINGLKINPEGVYVDATFGGGGHSAAILKELKGGKLYGFDQDADALENVPNVENFTLINHNFSFIKNFMDFYGENKIDGILADLGVSSHHFDTAERGFSFRFEGKLDMRMDQNASLSAETLLKTYSCEDLTKIFREYGEIKNARKLAETICNIRETEQINTTEDLAKIAKKFCNQKTENKYLSQVFQALRIEVNNEIRVLEDFLEASIDVLKPGGRFVVITYHSLEDRVVKRFFKTGNIEGKANKDFYGNVETPFKEITRKVIVPTEKELQENNRARSAKLRIVEKI